jgi:hypothetical protein
MLPLTGTTQTGHMREDLLVLGLGAGAGGAGSGGSGVVAAGASGSLSALSEEQLDAIEGGDSD